MAILRGFYFIFLCSCLLSFTNRGLAVWEESLPLAIFVATTDLAPRTQSPVLTHTWPPSPALPPLPTLDVSHPSHFSRRNVLGPLSHGRLWPLRGLPGRSVTQRSPEELVGRLPLEGMEAVQPSPPGLDLSPRCPQPGSGSGFGPALWLLSPQWVSASFLQTPAPSSGLL